MRFAAWLAGLAAFALVGPATLAAIDDRYPPLTWIVVALTVGGSVTCGFGCLFEIGRLPFRKSDVRVARPRRLGTRIGTLRPNDELPWDRFSDAERERRRRVLLYVVNETDHPETISIQADGSDVVWPRSPTRIYVEPRTVALDPHEGGNLDFLITNLGNGWPDKREWPNRIYWLRIRGHNKAGKIIRFHGLVRARPLRIVKPQAHSDYLFHVTRFGFIRPN
jgi:hypothetical protein